MDRDELRLAEWHVGPDWQIAKDDSHYLALGRLVAGLQTVEVLVRLALHEAHDSSVGGKPSVGLGAFHLLKSGDVVALEGNNHFDDFASLGKLIQRFNAQFPAHKLTEGLIPLRDAVAHGRVMPVKYKGEMVLKLLKFARPVEHAELVLQGLAPASAEVEFAELLTPGWFSRQQSLLDTEVEKVRAAVRTLPAPRQRD